MSIYTFDKKFPYSDTVVATFNDGVKNYPLNLTDYSSIAIVPSTFKLTSLTDNNTQIDPNLVPRIDTDAQYPFQTILKCQKSDSGNCVGTLTYSSGQMQTVNLPLNSTISLFDSKECPTVAISPPTPNNNQIILAASVCNGVLGSNIGLCNVWDASNKTFQRKNC